MTTQTKPYSIGTTVELEYPEAVERVKGELAKEGFGILCEIDVAATMKAKLGVDFQPYVILGACNPPLAHRALSAVRDIGVLLPCNVVVYAADIRGRSVIAAMDPAAALELTQNPQIEAVAEEVRGRLVRVLDRVAEPVASSSTTEAG